MASPVTQDFVDEITGCCAWATLVVAGLVGGIDRPMAPEKLLSGIALVASQDTYTPTQGCAEAFCAALWLGDHATDAELEDASCMMAVLLEEACTFVANSPEYALYAGFLQQESACN